MALIKFSPPPTLAGLFFCLASAEGAGLLFCPFAIHPHTSVYNGFLYHPWLYTANAVKPRTGLCRRFSCDLSHSTAADTRPTQAAIIPPAPRLSVSQRRSTSSTYQIPTTRRTLYSSAQPPIIIRYIMVRPCRGSMPDSAAYRRPYQPGGVSSYRLRIAGKCCTRRTCWGQRLHLYSVNPAAWARRRGTTGGLRRISFRAFAR